MCLRSFGLLGASGCGKTTLLHCIVGRLKISSGDITVFGKPPGSPGHNIPGKNVGYMPQVKGEIVVFTNIIINIVLLQEIGLYSYFSMSETLYYFGILHGMKIKDIRARRDFLQEFLELPPSHKLIRTLRLLIQNFIHVPWMVMHAHYAVVGSRRGFHLLWLSFRNLLL